MRKLSKEAYEILKVLADEYDKNSQTRLDGIDERVVGQRIGAYLGNIMYPVAELVNESLIGKTNGKLIITEQGYQSIKGPQHKMIGPIRSIYVATIEGIARAFKRP